MSCCCSGSSQEAIAKIEPCIVCGQRGRLVEQQTVAHLLRDPGRVSDQSAAHYFCPNPACEAVYFAPSNQSVFYKGQLKSRVGIKETEDPIPVCYCFDHTRASVWNEIEETGGSTVAASIKTAVQDGRCECEIRNPSGKCCLGEVTRTVQKGFERLSALQPVGD